jgi:hypothetical protein
VLHLIKTPRFNIDAVMRRDGKKAKIMQIDMILNTILMPMHSSMILILMPHTKLLKIKKLFVAYY